MRKMFMVLFSLISSWCCYGQVLQKSTIAAGGGSSQIGSTLIQATLGQPSLSGASRFQNTHVSQGFQSGSFLLYPAKITEVTFRLYPNPTQSFTRLEVDSVTLREIQLISSNGQTFDQKIDEQGIIDTSKLAPGVYFIKANITGQWVYITRLIVVK